MGEVLGRSRQKKVLLARQVLELREIQTYTSVKRRPAALSKQSRRLATLATQVATTLAIQVVSTSAIKVVKKSQHQVGQGPVREHSFCSQIITQI